ncbi:MAG TPA: murein biosynthesis integral membrane protein MurJ [Sandaracinaceae bacterium LLY-WYZ-13_1]|nr:murein biosynthesis integral membrane protein MurJ [Sandaracinaceae bacterium LLY-WYZ-13_1]
MATDPEAENPPPPETRDGSEALAADAASGAAPEDDPATEDDGATDERRTAAVPDERASGAIARRAGVVAAGTLTSRVLGFARDVVFAAVFPAAATDLFFVAFTIPNALRTLLGEGAVSSAVVPVFSEVRVKQGEEPARRYFAALTGLLGLTLLAVSALGVVAAPALVSVYATGYLDDPTRFAETVALTRAVFPYIFFIGLAALGIGGLNALRRFVVPAFAPALLNVALIAAAFTLVGPAAWLGLPPVGALCLGAVIGGLLQLVAQWPVQRRVGLLRMPRLDLSSPSVRKTLKLMVPLLAGFGVYQLNTMLGRSFATFLPTGSQSFIWYGQRLVEIPQGMFALAIAAASLPTLSELRSRGDLAKVREVFAYSLRLTLFLAIPSTVGLAVLAEPVVAVAFGRGEFSRAEVVETAASLRWQAAGVWAIASVRTVVPMFFAYQDTRSPVVASAANLVIFAAAALALMGPLEHVGIAVALSAAGVAQLAMLLWLLRRRAGRLGLRPVVGSALRIGAAAVVMGLVSGAIAQLGDWERGGNHAPNVAWLVAAVTTGAGVYLGAAWLLRVPELRELWAAARRRAAR